MRRPPRVIALGAKIALVLVAIVAVFYLGLLVRWPADRHVGYWMIDDRTLGVVVLDSQDLSCAVAQVDESVAAVRVHAQCNERVIPVPQPGMAQQYVFHVTLHAPLGGRDVYDGSGVLAQLCAKPAPDCWYSG